MEAKTENDGMIFAEGVLEIMEEGYGFLRSPDYNYLPGPGRYLRLAVADQAVRPAHRRHHLRPGASAEGNERYFALLKIEAVNFENPEVAKHKMLFDNLTPLYPNEPFHLEIDAGRS